MLMTILGVLLVLALISMLIPGWSAFRPVGGGLGLILLIVIIVLLVSGQGAS